MLPVVSLVTQPLNLDNVIEVLFTNGFSNGLNKEVREDQIMMVFGKGNTLKLNNAVMYTKMFEMQ